MTEREKTERRETKGGKRNADVDAAVKKTSKREIYKYKYINIRKKEKGINKKARKKNKKRKRMKKKTDGTLEAGNVNGADKYIYQYLCSNRELSSRLRQILLTAFNDFT